jgi:bifunctional non-homologous end joining protein LigD
MLMRSPPARDRRQPPGFIRPCKPVPSLKVPTGPGWIHELKHDGFRIVAHKDGDEVRLWSRNGRNWTAEMVATTAAVLALPAARIVLDGEAVAHCPKGLPDFNALLRRSGCASACFYAFDILQVGNEDLRGLALVERRALLRKHLRKAPPALLFSEHMEGEEGPAMFRHACAMGLEGIISKRVDSRYKSGRCLSWVKVKNPDYARQ